MSQVLVLVLVSPVLVLVLVLVGLVLVFVLILACPVLVNITGIYAPCCTTGKSVRGTLSLEAQLETDPALPLPPPAFCDAHDDNALCL